MIWRIEASGAIVPCAHCKKPIKARTRRFGRATTWYHVDCAGEAQPEAIASVTAPPSFARNAELEARLVANPEDTEVRAVFADWLQGQGDPWGELIALELAGKHAAAAKLRKRHLGALANSHGQTVARWKDGFIDELVVTGTRSMPNRAPRLLAEVVELRTAVIVRKLILAMTTDAAAVALASRLPTVTKIFTWLSPAIGELALPRLETLSLFVEQPRVDSAAYGRLFATTTLPALRTLDLLDKPLPLAFLEGLLESPLLRQLGWLVIRQNALDQAGAALVLSRQDRLAHLQYVSLSNRELQLDLDRAFAGRTRDWINRL